MTNYQCPTNASLTDVLDRFVWLGCLGCFGLWEDSSPWPPPRAAQRGMRKMFMLTNTRPSELLPCQIQMA
jgi:hypothetical protein